eukprot:1195121-Prorocentrum_minimum.AAC.2
MVQYALPEFWGVECTLAVIGTGGPVKQSRIMLYRNSAADCVRLGAAAVPRSAPCACHYDVRIVTSRPRFEHFSTPKLARVDNRAARLSGVCPPAGGAGVRDGARPRGDL